MVTHQIRILRGRFDEPTVEVPFTGPVPRVGEWVYADGEPAMLVTSVRWVIEGGKSRAVVRVRDEYKEPES